jgi:hypothetical protein
MSPAAAFSLWLLAIWLVVIAGACVVFVVTKRRGRNRPIGEHTDGYWR